MSNFETARKPSVVPSWIILSFVDSDVGNEMSAVETTHAMSHEVDVHAYERVDVSGGKGGLGACVPFALVWRNLSRASARDWMLPVLGTAGTKTRAPTRSRRICSTFDQ